MKLKRRVIRFLIGFVVLAGVAVGAIYLPPSSRLPKKALYDPVWSMWNQVGSIVDPSTGKTVFTTLQAKAELRANLRKFRAQISRGSHNPIQSAGVFRRLRRESGVRDNTFFLPLCLTKTNVRGTDIWVCGMAWETYEEPELPLHHVRVIAIDTRWPYRVIAQESCL